MASRFRAAQADLRKSARTFLPRIDTDTILRPAPHPSWASDACSAKCTNAHAVALTFRRQRRRHAGRKTRRAPVSSCRQPHANRAVPPTLRRFGQAPPRHRRYARGACPSRRAAGYCLLPADPGFRQQLPHAVAGHCDQPLYPRPATRPQAHRRTASSLGTRGSPWAVMQCDQPTRPRLPPMPGRIPIRATQPRQATPEASPQKATGRTRRPVADCERRRRLSGRRLRAARRSRRGPAAR